MTSKICNYSIATIFIIKHTATESFSTYLLVTFFQIINDINWLHNKRMCLI